MVSASQIIPNVIEFDRMHITLQKADELSTGQSAALTALSGIVYPPDVLVQLGVESIEWAKPQWRVIVWDETGEARAHIGIILRDGKVNDQATRIGGIGSVMTHPDTRGQGLCAKGLARAREFFAQNEVDVGLLVCLPELVPLYRKLGWRLHAGSLMVTQQGERVPFSFNLPMVHSIKKDVTSAAEIDLCGPPW